LVVKTDPEAPRHRNLSYFIFDCNSPGFTRKPLRQMTGESEFSELFFDNMRIPHENLIGELNMGWYAAMGTLVAERGGGISLGTGGVTVKRVGDVGHLVELARNTRRHGKAVWENTTFRQRIAQLAIENTAIECSGARAAARMAKGIPLADEVNISKLFMAEKNQRQGELMMEIMGAYSQLWQGSKYAINDGDFVYDALRSRGHTIEQGTSEINRNVIAERILGLPRIK
jgi:alkylation response protein AidB-like acyl-CoA dehydrogenase